MRALLAVAVALAVARVGSAHNFPHGYECSTCTSIIEQVQVQGIEALETEAERWTLRDTYALLSRKIASLDLTDPLSACKQLGMCKAQEAWMSAPAPENPAPFDLRVAPVFATKGYSNLRISVITNASSAREENGFFSYSQDFVYRWKNNHLESVVQRVVPGTPFSFVYDNVTVSINLPKENSGVRGIVIADPCYHSRWVGCSYGDELQTFVRSTTLLNAAMAHDDVDYWAIWGDNFYDRDGDIAAEWFAALSLDVKQKIFLSVPGNHDYWVHGAPQVQQDEDQYGYGFMQYYAQDTYASSLTSSAPYNFSVNPDNEPSGKRRLPDPSNFFFYNKIGNVAYIGFSSAYTLTEMDPYFREACAWLPTSNASVAFLTGHWNIPGLGCEEDMQTPAVFQEIKGYPGCAEFFQANKLKYQMGHVHCNEVTEKDIGFMVAGQGQDGCGNFGFPVVDTTGGRVRIMYFPVADTKGLDKYNETLACFQQNGVSGCYNMATTWLDQAL